MLLTSSRVLNYFNVKLDVFIIFIFIAFLAMLITLFFFLLDYLKMRKRYMEFMTGESGKELEYTIYKRFREIDSLKESQKDNDDQISIIYNKIRQSYSKLGIHKYDAFQSENNSSRGNMSFSLALLNSEDNGFIINAIHSRTGCHLYMKEIIHGECEAELADEEKTALAKALDRE